MVENNLTNEEEIILSEFKRLVKEVGLQHEFVYGNQYRDYRTLCFYKNKNVWESFIADHGQKFNSSKFDSLYELCLKMINSMDKVRADYCLKHFSINVEKKLNEYKSTQKVKIKK